MKKLSYFIPHLILILLLVNKKMIDNRKMKSHSDLRGISSLSENNILLKDNFHNIQSLENPDQGVQSLLHQERMDQKLLNDLKFSEKINSDILTGNTISWLKPILVYDYCFCERR